MRGINENMPIQDIFCSGLGAIERLEGGCLRFYFYVTQRGEDGEAGEKILVARIVMPSATVPDCVMQTIATLNAHSAKVIPMVTDLMN